MGIYLSRGLSDLSLDFLSISHVKKIPVTHNSIRKPNFGSLNLIYDVRRSAVDRIFPSS